MYDNSRQLKMSTNVACATYGHESPDICSVPAVDEVTWLPSIKLLYSTRNNPEKRDTYKQIPALSRKLL